jgi:catalase-peroxidase
LLVCFRTTTGHCWLDLYVSLAIKEKSRRYLTIRFCRFRSHLPRRLHNTDVNPGGNVDAPGDPVRSAADIRNVFSNGMSFNERETVSLVGGGHAVGKCHGACQTPPCGNGLGNNTFTSGFEGAWTVNPTQWDNEFFKNLFEYEWVLSKGPGPGDVWRPTAGPDVIMLTSDVAFLHDPVCRKLAMEYATDMEALKRDFSASWYKLVTADMGPAARCIGELVPPSQPFQNDLPAAPTRLPNYVPARRQIEALLGKDATLADAWINLAYRCASTFRQSDFHGGCNGARIRFAPESAWPANAGTQEALKALEVVKRQQSRHLSWSDLIVLAGLTALERENKSLVLHFCGGRVDATGPVVDKDLAPRVYRDPLVTILDDFLVKGLSMKQGVALASRQNVSSKYYQALLDRSTPFDEYERAMLNDATLKGFVQEFAQDEASLLTTFAEAWTQLMTADRFAKNTGNACAGVSTKTKTGGSKKPPVKKCKGGKCSGKV